ncbi:hypothetical protein, partial [Brucella intermedia]|uniref:hypothetical protein n=1 Tax=Brucella intermedia TaxID=94625 RepID=UPI001AEFE1C4
MTPTLSEEAVKAAQNAIRTTNWEYGITDADMAKALTAALPFLSVQGAVKKLEWELVSGDHYAEGAGTHYNIYETKPGLWNSVMVKPVSVRLATNADLEAAKAAAQADFEARILSAIETGITVSQPSCAKIKAARKAVEELANTPMNLPLEDWSRISSAILSALEPSAARELALEEGYRQGIEAAAQIIETKQEGFQVRGGGRVLIDRSEGDQSGLGYAAAIRALSSPDHADAGHTQARDVLARFRDYVIEGITAGTIMRGGEHHNPIWQEVAGVLHADAGKVEGDGWLPIDETAKSGRIVRIAYNRDDVTMADAFYR